MTVAELIRQLEKMPQDREVLMYDGIIYYSPSSVSVCEWNAKRHYGKVVID